MRWLTPNLNNAERKRGNPITYQTGIRRIYERIEMADERHFKEYTASNVYTSNRTVRRAKKIVQGVEIKKVHRPHKWSGDLFTEVVFTALDDAAASAFKKALADLKWIECTIEGLQVSADDIDSKKPRPSQIGFLVIERMTTDRCTGNVTEITVRVASIGTARAFERVLRSK